MAVGERLVITPSAEVVVATTCLLPEPIQLLSNYHEYNFLIYMYDILGVQQSIVYTPAHSKIRIRVHPMAFHDNAITTKAHQQGICTTLPLHASSKEVVRTVLIQGAV